VLVQANRFRKVLWLDARRPEDALSLEDVVNRVPVDAEPGGELLDPPPAL
jgi:hypothetical protein